MQVKSTAKGEHSAIPLTFIKQPLVIKIFVLSIFEWLFCLFLNGHFTQVLLFTHLDWSNFGVGFTQKLLDLSDSPMKSRHYGFYSLNMN